MRLGGRLDINRQADTGIFQSKPEDPPAFSKSKRLTDREDRKALDALQNFIDMGFFRCADEQDFAIFQVLQIFPPFIAPDNKAPWPNFFVFHYAIENVSERIDS